MLTVGSSCAFVTVARVATPFQFQEGNFKSGHAEFGKICSLLDKIHFKGDKVAVPKDDPIDPAKVWI